MARPELEVEDLEEKIPEINESNRLYAEGDHWQDGAGYSGALMAADNPSYSEWLADKERTFVSMDILSEVRKRERWALTGKAWTWHLRDENNEPLGDEGKELTNWINNWFEKKQIVSTIADCIENSSWSGEDGQNGRGILRFYIPESRLENGRVDAEDLGQALELIELESPDSGTAVVFTDADSEYEPVGFIKWVEEKGGDEIERSELVYVDEQGLTILETLEGESTGSIELNLLKKLTMYQLERPLLITSSMRSQQKFLNHSMTAFQATISAAGWPEDFFMGILPPGEWIEGEGDDPDTFVAAPIDRGPGRTHFFQPSVTEDEDGIAKAIQGGVHSKSQQASPHLFTEAKKEGRENILASAFQEYTSLTGLAQASGEKLQLAKGDFEASATDMANETRLMVRWVIETALAMAENITGTTEPTDYNVFVDVRIDTGVVTTEQKIQLSQLVAENFIPLRTALSEAGYSHPEAEVQQIIKEIAELAQIKEAAASRSVAGGGGSGEGGISENGSENGSAPATESTPASSEAS